MQSCLCFFLLFSFIFSSPFLSSFPSFIIFLSFSLSLFFFLSFFSFSFLLFSYPSLIVIMELQQRSTYQQILPARYFVGLGRMFQLSWFKQNVLTGTTKAACLFECYLYIHIILYLCCGLIAFVSAVVVITILYAVVIAVVVNNVFHDDFHTHASLSLTLRHKPSHQLPFVSSIVSVLYLFVA